MAELSDERIHRLLTEAEDRLAATPYHDITTDVGQPTLKLDSPSLVVGAKGGIARPPQQRLAVRDAHQTNPKVCYQPYLLLRDLFLCDDKLPMLYTIDVANKLDDAGQGWFGLPKTDPNDKEFKRDVQLLQMRGTALDPSRHYKKESLKAKMPRYAHVGRIVEGPTDFYSSRLNRKERKMTLVDELLAAEKASGKFKAKFNDIQGRKASGKKASYKRFVSQRRRRN
ncbi:rRNA-processing protein FCF2 [Verticillium alfalfae VaMs.102]|uniref:rRNA-processing protein FCF2 n=1 Tax=Verticillium alfalfae (strain VaMs.102 / ATCC MYA-4576 / FGSC 10136) TaxID=526221 RepID=C9SR41_VERA1|nr:rRNA-processing protein FCF2 [Verticillium alfalfae VaMs.102]EEY20843.1 rRNA-processing protein FCF2 [Verticillium alfalfae VaMs.102]